VKWPALLFNAAVVFICAGLLWYRLPFDAADSMTARILVVLVVAAAHALYFLLLATPERVKAAARTYARQLILSCETFFIGAKPAGKAARYSGPSAASRRFWTLWGLIWGTKNPE
jgi:hypothetical protein